MNELQKLMIVTVDDRYHNEEEFYKLFDFTQDDWEKIKAGELNMDELPFKKVNSMLWNLFTKFELNLFEKAIHGSRYDSDERTPLEIYNEYKKEELAKIWNCSEKGIVFGRKYSWVPDGAKKTHLKITSKFNDSIKMFYGMANENAPKFKNVEEARIWYLQELAKTINETYYFEIAKEKQQAIREVLKAIDNKMCLKHREVAGGIEYGIMYNISKTNDPELVLVGLINVEGKGRMIINDIDQTDLDYEKKKGLRAFLTTLTF